MNIDFVRVNERAILPRKNNDIGDRGDSGYDIFSIENVMVPARGSAIISTGIKVGYITPGYWFKIEARSGLGFKKGIQPHFGVIDQPYRGDLGIKLYNLTDSDVLIEEGQACAQFVIYHLIPSSVNWMKESDVELTGRGEKGFGSSDRKIKVSHEVPLCLLEESRLFNDYDYALVHLFNNYPSYYNFFKESLSKGREVILDNSIFELGESFDIHKFAKIVKELKPTKYIIPDALENMYETLDKLRTWINLYSTLPGIKIGVIQGETYGELVECYKHMDKLCDEIAISFDYSYYSEKSVSDYKPVDWCEGRKMLIDRMISEGIINYTKKHHLLGCSLPQEFNHYKSEKYSFINSIDTSNPIVHGIRGISYKENGLEKKESIKLVDLIEYNVDEDQMKVIKHNVTQFKKFL